MAKLTIGTIEKQDSLVSEVQVVKIVRETPKAILVSQKIQYEGRDLAGHGERKVREHLACTLSDSVNVEELWVVRQEWLPKSQCQISSEEIVIPGWLANQKFFVYQE